VGLRFSKIRVLGVALLTVLVFATNAYASGKPGAYSGNGGNVQQQVQSAAGRTQTLAGLPLTGLDLALFVGAGFVLLIAGLSVRRFAKNRA
jgi:hypothetical protein